MRLFDAKTHLRLLHHRKYLPHRVVGESRRLPHPSRRVERHRGLYDERSAQGMPFGRQLQSPAG